MAFLDFWYEFGSSYSYPTAMRIDELAAKSGVEVHWRPFMLGPILAAEGMSDSPFNIYPARGRYMVRDLERTCAALNLPFSMPDPFPQNGLYAARLALIGADEGWIADFSRAVYRAEFGDGANIFDRNLLAQILSDLGVDSSSCLDEIGSSEAKERLKYQTAEAHDLGIFGAPSFIAGGELYWGNDRLEQAIDRAVREG
jgi:2-hydroxychromene-2-carboxylate isomerase